MEITPGIEKYAILLQYCMFRGSIGHAIILAGDGGVSACLGL